MEPATIIIALGSNRRHGRFGAPASVIRAAVEALGAAGLPAVRLSPISRTAAVGLAGREFANAAITATSDLAPPQILAILKGIETAFGRRGGRRWGARVLDLDLIAWGERVWPSRLQWVRERRLAVPHRALHVRDFVLVPMAAVAPTWRHPVLNLTTRHMLARLRRPRDRR